MSRIRLDARLVAIVIGAAMLSACGGESIVTVPLPTVPGYQQTNLVADVAGAANATDEDLVNPWGLAAGPDPFNTFWWVANNHTASSTLYDGAGVKSPPPPQGPLTVAVPGAPTGLVFNGGDGFVLNGAPARFIFASEDGTISGWNQGLSPITQAVVAVDNSSQEAIYKGLALASNGAANLLFATDFHNAKIDVFDDTFAPKTLAGDFSDPDIPDGFAPFGIQAIDNQLYVTYAMQDEDAEDDVPGAGYGFVDVFDTDGNLVKRFATQGPLNAPWGVTMAPADFGPFSNALLVGNFGDGRITAFAADSGDSLGQLADTHGTPIAIDGLWGLAFGNGGNAGPTNTLFFTAGTDDETHGLFGSLVAVGSSGMP